MRGSGYFNRGIDVFFRFFFIIFTIILLFLFYRKEIKVSKGEAIRLRLYG